MRKHRKYVVGYRGDEDCIYGEEHFLDRKCGIAIPLVFTKARKLLKTMYEAEKACIYKLVPVKLKEKK